jgi:biotin-(acetyl-CoA carboxylase) ligase
MYIYALHIQVSGALIEMDGDYILVGIGVNLTLPPTIPATGVDGGRPATALALYNSMLSTYTVDQNSEGR